MLNEYEYKEVVATLERDEIEDLIWEAYQEYMNGFDNSGLMYLKQAQEKLNALVELASRLRFPSTVLVRKFSSSHNCLRCSNFSSDRFFGKEKSKLGIEI